MGGCYSSLLPAGIDAELLGAVIKDDVNKATRLIRNGANVNAVVDCRDNFVKRDIYEDSRYTAVFWSTKFGQVKCLEVLLKHGANPNTTDIEGVPVLMWAIGGDHAGCLDLLLKHGADVNASDTTGGTAIMLAAQKGDYNALGLLLMYGADPNVTHGRGCKPLMFLAEEGRTDCVELLLKHGADVHASDDLGRTPLTLAAQWRGTDCIEVLLKAGADKNIDDMKEALELAVGNENDEAAAILRKYLSQLNIQQTSHNVVQGGLSSGLSIPRPSAPYMTIPLTPSQSTGREISHQNWSITFDEVQLGSLLGKGSYAKVFSATWHGSEVAAKLFEFRRECRI